ncbi:sugar transferase [Eubacteriaceae bacterium ES2]|nr:sugar transferase [Eubacteriaceae bacterium ES2]
MIYQRYIKRLCDFFLSLLAIIILSPIILIIAIMVRAKLGSPIIFRQERPGLNERIFTMYKFRTMTNACDEKGQLLPAKDRVTRFGDILRSTSMDELPELVNVLKGDMSVIGPRPLLVQYLDRYNDFQKRRHQVRPGVTGLAQVNGRNTISWEDKFFYDVEYVDHVTFLGDVKIFFQTIKKVLIREGINDSEGQILEEFMGTPESEEK